MPDVQSNSENPMESPSGMCDAANLPLKDAIKLYKKAILWSLAISLAPIMEGYDVVLLGSFFGLGSFAERYGSTGPDGVAVLSAAWQSGINCGELAGCIIGLYLNSVVAERIGYKFTLIGSAGLMIAFIFLTFFAQNIITIEAGAVLIGIPWGVFQILPLTYIAEVIPIRLRGYMTTFINLCFVTGQLIGSGVVKAFSSRVDEWSYRMPLAIQWAWPLPVILFTLFAPDSPWWLVRRGRIEEAKKSLRRLTSSSCGVSIDIDYEISIIQATNEQEIALATGTGYTDCFKGINLRRTEIVSIVWLAQTFCGFGLVSYSVVFLERAGLSQSNSFSFTVGVSGLGWIGTFALVYDVTIGPVCFAIVSEVPSTRLKIKSLAIARNIYNMGFIITNILVPRMLSAEAWNWGAKGGYFWAGMCMVLLVWTFIRLPETAGRSFAEIDTLFEHGISAREFSTTDTTQFALELPDAKKPLEEMVEYVDYV